MSDSELDADEYEDDFIDDDGAEGVGSDDEDYGSKRKRLADKKALKKKKKNKPSANYFLEEEADEDDEDESDYGEHDEYERRMAEVQRQKLQKEMERKRGHGPDFLGLQDDEDLDEYFKKRQEYEDLGEDNKMSNLPTASDPKLFVVKCKEGFEAQACNDIMDNYFKCLGTAQEFQIFSASFVEKTKGYIYIEAFVSKHAYYAIANIGVCAQKVTLVDFQDRTQVFEPDPTKDLELAIDQWVRIKNDPIYKGDLGQVVDIDSSRKRALIKLVPRIAPYTEGDEEKKAEYEIIKTRFGVIKKRKKIGGGLRQPQRLFQENEYQGVQNKRNTELDIVFDVYDGDQFFKGLLYKHFSYKHIQTKDVEPTFEELKFFAEGDMTDEKLINSLADQTHLKSKKFFKGDKVRIIKGDLMNLEGEIVKVNDSNVTIRPLDTEFTTTIEISPNDIVKAFKKGEFVKVIAGKNTGKTGFIQSLNDNSAKIMADGLTNIVEAFINDLIYCNESTQNVQLQSSGNAELQNYKRFDLIKLNDYKTVAIVLVVANDHLKCLDNFGNIRNLKSYEIEQKLNTSKNMTKNDKGQTFRVKDSVRVLEGRYKGSVGIVKHIYNDFIFIHSDEIKRTEGCCIEKSNNCYMLSSQINATSKTIGVKGRDPIIGKKVCIIGGPWKGYEGIAREGNERTLRVELTARCRILDVKRDLVKAMSDLAEKNEPVQKTNLEAKTPMIKQFPQSPGFGMTSPSWGFESPHYDSHLNN